MAYQNSTVSFEKMLLKFIADEDPMQSMLKWLCERLMETEVENKLCGEKLKQIWLQLDYESAKKYATAFMNDYELKYPQAIKVLEDGLKDSLQFQFSRKISSTNLLERLNKEICRRTKVVGIFLSMDAHTSGL